MADERYSGNVSSPLDDSLKSYKDFLEEISSEDLFEGLLGYGLFDDKLPPIFSSASFARFCSDEGLLPVPRGGCEYVTYRYERNVGGVRIMGIPHPLAYAKLCRELADDWEEIRDRLIDNVDDQAYKVSRIHLRKRLGTKRLFEMNYSNWSDDGDPIPQIQIDSRYEVISDITQCFPSIYSHAVCWALVGKEKAKQARGNNRYWFNKIDFALRNCTYSETHGVLIGPHASNLIAEIILTCVDKELVSKGYKFVRYVDDYRCFAETHERAEEFVQDLDSELYRYGLMRNQRKTKILSLPAPSEEEWPRALKSFPLPNEGRLSRGQVLAFLDFAIDLLNGNEGNAAILNYALRMLSGRKLTKPAQSLVLNRSLQFVRIYPYLSPIMDELVFSKFNVNKEDLSSVARDLLAYAKQKKSWFPAYYAIYYALKYDFNLAGLNVAEVIESGDCILKVLELAYARAHNNREAQKKLKEDARSLQEGGDAAANWVFVYEALSAEELKGDLKNLKKAGVSFLDSCGAR